MHEADLADERYDTPEAAGMDVFLRGLAMIYDDDDQLLEGLKAAVRRVVRVPQAGALARP